MNLSSVQIIQARLIDFNDFYLFYSPHDCLNDRDDESICFASFFLSILHYHHFGVFVDSCTLYLANAGFIGMFDMFYEHNSFERLIDRILFVLFKSKRIKKWMTKDCYLRFKFLTRNAIANIIEGICFIVTFTFLKLLVHFFIKFYILLRQESINSF